jgi:hypothetical protein
MTLPDAASPVDVCEVCGDDGDERELEATTSWPGWDGRRVVVCLICGAVYDALDGVLLDDGSA